MAARLVISEWYSAWLDDGSFTLEPVGDPDDPSRPLPGDDPEIRAAMAEWIAGLMARPEDGGDSPA